MSSDDNVKTMRLRYAGTCSGCSTEIDKGERAHYLRDVKTVRCLECGPDDISGESAAGRSAASEAAKAAGQARTLADRKAEAERRAAAFAAGAEGERIVAEQLAPLSAAGYVVLHDRSAGGRSNLDHIAIGPTGVWMINAKHWSGEVTVTDTLRHNGRSRARQLKRAIEERDKVVEVLRAGGVDAPVWSMFAFTSASPEARTDVSDIVLVAADKVRAVIGSADALLDGRTVDRAVAVIVGAFPPAGEMSHTLDVSDDDLPEDLRDTEVYVFINPWTKNGHRRLYVHRCGQDFGYVDLNAGSWRQDVEHPRAEGTLKWVLKWFADASDEPKQLGRLGRLAKWYVDQNKRRVVAVRFRRPGTDRLYVHLFDGSSRHQIGYVDLLGGTVHAAEPEFASVVARAATLRPSSHS